LLLAVLDVLGLALLLVGIAGLVTTWHWLAPAMHRCVRPQENAIGVRHPGNARASLQRIAGRSEAMRPTVTAIRAKESPASRGFPWLLPAGRAARDPCSAEADLAGEGDGVHVHVDAVGFGAAAVVVQAQVPAAAEVVAGTDAVVRLGRALVVDDVEAVLAQLQGDAGHAGAGA